MPTSRPSKPRAAFLHSFRSVESASRAARVFELKDASELARRDVEWATRRRAAAFELGNDMSWKVRDFAATRSVLLSVRFLVPALLAPLAGINPAQAGPNGCTPTAPVNNATITCTGATTNTNGNVGFGTAADIGNTYNINSAAAITGDTIGLLFGVGTVNVDAQGSIQGTNAGSSGISGNTATVTNFGLIGGASSGISAVTLTLTNNTGTITSALGGVGLLGISSVTIGSNNGTISGDTAAIQSNGTANITNGSAGAIVGNAVGIKATGDVTLANAGFVGGDTAIAGRNVTVTNDDSAGHSVALIQGASFGINATGDVAVSNSHSGELTAGDGGTAIHGNTVTVSDAGRLIGASGNGSFGINADTAVTITSNTGRIAGDTAIFSGGTANITNLTGGEILGVTLGVHAAGDATVANAGTISASDPHGVGVGIGGSGTITNAATGVIFGRTAILSGNSVAVNNAGQINGLSTGIAGQQDVTVANSGSISAVDVNGVPTPGGVAIFGNGSVTVTANTGTIVGDTAILAPANGTINNAGQINGVSVGIEAGTANIANSGTISASGPNGVGIAAGFGVTLANTGVVQGTNFGVQSFGTSNIFNSGRISGGVGIQSGEAAAIVNAGTIIGTGGTAIQLSNANDTLTLLTGSKIVGVVDMGGGNDVVNVNVVAPKTKVSSLTSVQLPTFINFSGPINTSVSASGFAGPAVVSGLTVATLDPTALSQADRTLMDFSGGVSSLVQGRLNGNTSLTGGNMTAMSYADSYADSYAADLAPAGSTAPFAKVPASQYLSPAPITVWANSFGGQRVQNETAATLRSTSTVWGGAIGVDRKVSPNWLVGAFIGGGQGGLSVDQNSQTVNTDYVFAGVYSRYEWMAQFLDFTLQGGNAANKSRRMVLDNGAPETASADYNGWFISPEVAYGRHFDLNNGYVLTPMARIRYVAGIFGGFNEAGSAENVSVSGRTLQDFEERGEVDLARTMSFGGDHELKANIHGGVIALQRAGDSNISAILLGQGLSFATPGSNSAVGVVAGAGFDYHTSKNVAWFGAVEGQVMSDQSRTVTGRAGVRVSF